jgi:hypothetical protein
MNRAARRRDRHVAGDWITTASTALADLERARAGVPVAGVVVAILVVPPAAWISLAVQ